MQVNIRKLRGRMAEVGVTQRDLAKRLGLNAGTVSHKMRSGGLTFTAGQLLLIAEALELSKAEVSDIFFAE